MSFTCEVDLEGAEQDFREGLLDLGIDLGRAVASAVKAGESAARAACPVGKGPTAGATKAGIAGNITSADQYGAEGEVDAQNMPVSLFIVGGTKPHDIGPIYPVKAQALRFVVGGQVIFRKSVKVIHHPGTKPNDFMKPAEDAAQSIIDSEGDAAIDKFIKRLTG